MLKSCDNIVKNHLNSGPGMDEKIYYKDERVKVTDLRITCNHITVPIEKIENVIVDFKITTMLIAFTVLLLSIIAIPSVCYFFDYCGYYGIILLLPELIWLRMLYLTYTELKISLGSRTIKILDASMNKREYIFRIEDALKIAMLKTSGTKEAGT